MLTGIRHLLSGLRWYAINILTFLRGGRTAVPAFAPVVCFDLQANHWHRHLHILMHFFEIKGYAVRIRHRYRFIASWASHDLFRFSSPFRMYWGQGAEKGARWLFTDRPVKRPHVLLDADYYPVPGEREQDPRIPMSLVDTFYVFRLLDRIAVNPEEARRRGVFFFGNMDPLAYGRSEPAEVFNCLTRTDLINTVRRRFPDRVVTPREAKGIAVHGGRDIVLVDRKDHYITPDRLPGVLGEFDFFLAPSGVVMPLCHNLVEAIAAGCIPILQHPHLMVPHLEHGRNCFAFRDEAGLAAILERIPHMPEKEVRDMRANVLAYYRSHLAPEAVIGRLEQEGSDLRRVRLNGELYSTNILREKLARMGSGGLPLPHE